MAEVAKNPSIFVCPHCNEGFIDTNQGVICPNGHSFDRAREGYLNLLPTGRLASSAVPGDTANSLAARRRFLSTGAYQPIADALAEAVGEINGPVLDVGCGEGYYLDCVDSPHKFGIDISKRAVQMASKAFTSSVFAVANAFRLPVVSNSCDAVINVFAPHSIEEFERILTRCGQWVTITPGSHHLQQMRPKRDGNIIERELRRDAPPSHGHNATRIKFELDLTKESAEDLFLMTPLVWQTAANAGPVTTVSVDIWVSVGFKP